MGRPRGLSLEDALAWHGWKVCDSECWEFTGKIRKDGYGEVKIRGTRYPAHRLAFMAWVGVIPLGLMVRHTCDNRCCVNPEHLLLGTAQDNMDDKMQRGRHVSVRGEFASWSKLTQEQVDRVRADKGRGKQRMYAKLFGVSEATISLVVNGKRWKED